MIDGKKVIAIIPARGGSKGLPGKNIKKLCGKPLIGWSIETAMGSEYIDTIVVSTDDEDIARIANKFGAIVPFMRPSELASDTATTFDTVKHCIEYYESEHGSKFDILVLMEPTSPLREERDVDIMLEKLIADYEDSDSIISIGEVFEHPSILKKIVNNRLQPFRHELSTVTRRQDQEPAYFPYGVAYIIKVRTLLEKQDFYTKQSLFYCIKRYQCYEIDDIYDFLAIENIMKYEWKQR